MTLPYKFLRDHRNRLWQPHHLAGPLSAWLATLASLCDGVGRETNDQRWHTLASELDRAAVAVRAHG